MKRLLVLLVVIVVASLFAGCPKPHEQQQSAVPAMGGENPSDNQTPSFSDAVTAIDDFAPDFVLLDPSGNQVSKADFSGKVLILDFWSTTCSACVKKLNEYVSLYDRYSDSGVEWLAVSLDAKPEAAAAAAKEHKWPYRVAMFNDELKASYFADEAILSIPQVRIIDRDGNLRYSFNSASTVQDLELALKELADETVGGDEAISEDVVSDEPTEEADAEEGSPGLPDSFDAEKDGAAPPTE